MLIVRKVYSLSRALASGVSASSNAGFWLCHQEFSQTLHGSPPLGEVP